MSSLPPALQQSIEKNAQLAEWRATQKEAVQAEKAAAAENAEPVVKLRKDGTPMRKRGPKPKTQVKKENTDDVVIKVENPISKQQKKAEREWADILRNSAEDVLEFVFNVYTKNNDLSDDFLNHLTKLVAKERRQRKRALAETASSSGSPN